MKNTGRRLRVIRIWFFCRLSTTMASTNMTNRTRVCREITEWNINVELIHSILQLFHSILQLSIAIYTASNYKWCNPLTIKAVLLCCMKCRGRSQMSRRTMSIARRDKRRSSSKPCTWRRERGREGRWEGWKGEGGVCHFVVCVKRDPTYLNSIHSHSNCTGPISTDSAMNEEMVATTMHIWRIKPLCEGK